LLLVGITAFTVSAVHRKAQQNAARENENISVALTAGDDPMPSGNGWESFRRDHADDSACALSVGGFVGVLHGTNLLAGLRSGTNDIFAVYEDASGLHANAEIWGPDRQIIALVRDNKLIGSNNILRIEKHRSSLSVFDTRNNEVMSLRYLNKRAVVFHGLVWLPSGTEVRITDTNVFVPSRNSTFNGGLMDGDASIAVLTLDL
jgi:hypothetical protein